MRELLMYIVIFCIRGENIIMFPYEYEFGTK